ncbi:MAG: hypothetical protein RLN72_03835 [Henriciella sp.]
MFIRTHKYNRPFPFGLLAIYTIVLLGILVAAGQGDAGLATDLVDAAAAADKA